MKNGVVMFESGPTVGMPVAFAAVVTHESVEKAMTKSVKYSATDIE